MSVTTSQPSPFGYLTREKHIKHLFGVSKEEKKICHCLEVLPIQTSQQEKDFKKKHQIEEISEKHKIEMLSNSNIIIGEQCDQVSTENSLSGKVSRTRPLETKRKIHRVLTAVEVLDESTSSELQMLADTQQFFITSKAKTQGLTCQPERLYMISSRTAKQLFVAIEDASCLCLHLCGPARSCHLRLCNQSSKEVLRFYRPYRMDVCCLFCCLMVIRVHSSANSLIGSVQQRWSLFSPCLSVYNSDGKELMKIKGSWSAARCHSDQEFQVTSLNGQLVAIIWKRWPGFNEDYNMDHEFFGLDSMATVIAPAPVGLRLASDFLIKRHRHALGSSEIAPPQDFFLSNDHRHNGGWRKGLAQTPSVFHTKLLEVECQWPHGPAPEHGCWRNIIED
ncbi:phospholipid scramblase 3-like [Pelodytes ibericus]